MQGPVLARQLSPTAPLPPSISTASSGPPLQDSPFPNGAALQQGTAKTGALLRTVHTRTRLGQPKTDPGLGWGWIHLGWGRIHLGWGWPTSPLLLFHTPGFSPICTARGTMWTSPSAQDFCCHVSQHARTSLPHHLQKPPPATQLPQLLFESSSIERWSKLMATKTWHTYLQVNLNISFSF